MCTLEGKLSQKISARAFFIAKIEFQCYNQNGMYVRQGDNDGKIR